MPKQDNHNQHSWAVLYLAGGGGALLLVSLVQAMWSYTRIVNNDCVTEPNSAKAGMKELPYTVISLCMSVPGNNIPEYYTPI